MAYVISAILHILVWRRKIMANSSVLLPSSIISSVFLSPTRTPTLTIVRVFSTTKKSPIKEELLKRGTPKTLSTVSSQNQRTIATIAEDEEEEESRISIDSASEVVRNFYKGINGHDLTSVENLIAENCVYEDLVFPRPFVGRKAILEFFNKFTDSISKDLQFVIDDISDEDSLAIGVTWHLEWQGKPFPFSRGCSFYRLEILNGKKQIIYGRDSVEPFIKPGETALVAIKGVTWLLQRFPKLAEQFR